jgi:hypothetical protein
MCPAGSRALKSATAVGARHGRLLGAIGAVVARFVHTEEVTGSNPVSPTTTRQPLACINAEQGLSSFEHVSDTCRTVPLIREGPTPAVATLEA